MGQHKLKKQPKDVGQETAVLSEVGFYQGWCEVMQLAFKKDGMMGVLSLAGEIIAQGDAMAAAAEKESPGCTNMHRALLAHYFASEWYEPVLKELRLQPDGPWYFELKDGGTTDFPTPGQELRTFTDSLKIREETAKTFKDYARLHGSTPAAAKELAQMLGAKYMNRPV